MNYNNIRNQILNGDVVFMEPVSTLGSVIPAFTGGKVSHCGLAVWVTDSRGCKRLMLLEGHLGGCRLVTLSSYAHRKLVVLQLGIQWSTIEDYALEKPGVVSYSVWDFPSIWLRETLVRNGHLRTAKLVPDAPGEVCSQVVADILVKANLQLRSTLVSPNGLLEELKTDHKPLILE